MRQQGSYVQKHLSCYLHGKTCEYNNNNIILALVWCGLLSVADCYQTLQHNAAQLTPLLPYLSDRRPDIVQRMTSCIAACERWANEKCIIFFSMVGTSPSPTKLVKTDFMFICMNIEGYISEGNIQYDLIAQAVRIRCFWIHCIIKTKPSVVVGLGQGHHSSLYILEYVCTLGWNVRKDTIVHRHPVNCFYWLALYPLLLL